MLYRHQLEVLNTGDTGRWNEVLDETGVYDFYHLPAFHHLAEIHGEGAAVMPVFREKGYVVAMPVLIRDILIPSVADVGDGLKDATSVCGFVGPSASPLIPDDVKAHFQETIHDYLDQSKIVTVYNRLNPLTTPQSLLEGFGEISQVGVTISIDLSVTSEERFSRYRKDHRKDIRRLKREGFACEKVGMECLDDFLCIYRDTMDRVQASSDYYYDKSYFEYLLSEMTDTVHLFICRVDGEVASAYMVTDSGGIIGGYLSGTSDKYTSLGLSKLLYDEICDWGSERDASVFHVGGGVGAQRDSLYDFKMGFGGREHIYSTWRHVVNPKMYDELCRESIKSVGITPKEPYFPIYRHPTLSRRML